MDDMRYDMRPDQRIGVHDYQSLCDCVKHNFEAAFPGVPTTDPQDMIQRMSACIMKLRREQKDRGSWSLRNILNGQGEE